MTRDELIEKMLDGFERVPDHTLGRRRESCRRAGMAAALDVVLAEVLGEPSFEECRAKYSKVKTAEDQITLTEVSMGWWVNGPENKTYFAMSNGYRKEHAEIYRLGLIAQLKEGK